MDARQDSDNLAWDESDARFAEAMRHVRLTSTCRTIQSFAERIFKNNATLVTPLVIGGYNALYPFQVEGLATNALIRVPCPNQAVFPEEKTFAEAATAACVSKWTQVPVPKTLCHGVDPAIGPFIIMEALKSRRGMCKSLQAPRLGPNDPPILNPNISETKLKSLWVQLARCVLQLAQPTFPRIGSLVETNAGSYSVMGRPLTLNMNNMVQLSNIPKSIFPPEGTTYQSADEWYVALAEMQMATLIFQHNDMVSSEDDCRTKYVARQLFRRLAKQGLLSKFGFAEDNWSVSGKHAPATLPAPHNSGSFRLWSDDFRPGNVMTDENDQIIGVIDWEYAYVGPTQFVLDSPWWLLLDVPEMWDNGIDDWARVYEERLPTWLSVMEKVEQSMGPWSLPLSAYMKESWTTGRFWLNYAAKKSWSFDTIYWKYLDEKFFGERQKGIPEAEWWKTRVHLLSEEEQFAMDPLVEIKMEESNERILVEWEDEEARERLSSFLFD